jgi:uncharacterized cupin superfamily protein
MSTRKIVSFQDPPPTPTVDHPRPDRLVVGDPARTTWNRYTDPSERVFAGEWACEPGAWRVAYPEGQDEFCAILEGSVRLTDDAGESVTFGPGERFVVPGGFTGVWETLTPLKKLYVIVSL